MPRPKSVIPPYRHHKSTGRAVVYVERKAIYLGKYDSPESRQRYAEVTDRLTKGQPVDTQPKYFVKADACTVARLVIQFTAQRLPKYSDAEQACMRGAMRVLRELFGETPAEAFGPVRLETVRDAMVAGNPEAVDPQGKPRPRKPWSRCFINKQVKRLRLVFKFGVSKEMVPPSVLSALQTLEPLRPGRTEAPEGRPRQAVPDSDLQAVRPHLSALCRDLFDLMLLTGARPGEMVGLKTGQLDRSGEIWKVEFSKHKTSHFGKERKLFFNATAQGILLKYLKADPEARLFAIRRDTFGAAVKAACVKAGVPEFTPHWLRHTVATKLMDDAGVETAQRLLGHSTAAMTEHYSRAAQKKAIEGAKLLGLG